MYHIVAHVNYSISVLCSNVVFIIITHRITKIYRSPFLKILKMMKYKLVQLEIGYQLRLFFFDIYIVKVSVDG